MYILDHVSFTIAFLPNLRSPVLMFSVESLDFYSYVLYYVIRASWLSVSVQFLSSSSLEIFVYSTWKHMYFNKDVLEKRPLFWVGVWNNEKWVRGEGLLKLFVNLDYLAERTVFYRKSQQRWLFMFKNIWKLWKLRKLLASSVAVNG